MDVKKIFEDPRVIMLEEDIAFWNDNRTYKERDKEDAVVANMLRQRYYVLRNLQVYDAETKALLVEFNDALRSAATELYNRANIVYDEYANRNDYFGEFEVEGKLYLGFDYPSGHPIQSDRAKSVWDALTQGGYDPLYDDGCTWSLYYTKDRQRNYKDVLHWLGLEDESDNWNEGLNPDWSKDMHLIHAFHNLYDHMNFSLFDLIWVRDFNIEINLKFDGNIGI